MKQTQFDTFLEVYQSLKTNHYKELKCLIISLIYTMLLEMGVLLNTEVLFALTDRYYIQVFPNFQHFLKPVIVSQLD